MNIDRVLNEMVSLGMVQTRQDQGEEQFALSTAFLEEIAKESEEAFGHHPHDYEGNAAAIIDAMVMATIRFNPEPMKQVDIEERVDIVRSLLTHHLRMAGDERDERIADAIDRRLGHEPGATP